MTYVLHPSGHVTPVFVSSDESVELMLTGLEALGLLDGRWLDEEWWPEEGEMEVADVERWESARQRYGELQETDDILELLRASGVHPTAADVIGQLFAFLDDISGSGVVVQHVQ